MKQVREGHYYINKKSGEFYFIYKLATDVSNNIKHDVVVYAGINNPNKYYTRELEEFKNKFKDPNE